MGFVLISRETDTGVVWYGVQALLVQPVQVSGI